MKIGITYNLFNGEELLEGSIKSIRDNVDFIGVIYQLTSNHGDSASDGLLKTLTDLVNDGLIDAIKQYTPQLGNHPKNNELNKRNIGLDLAKSYDCDYHMSMDSDEFYTDEQFKYMIKTIVDGGYDMGVCQMCSYYKTPEYRLSPNEDYYVSVLHRIDDDTKFSMNYPCSVVVDPTRKTNFKKMKIFSRDEIEMHHMTYVRNDMRSKLNNAGARVIYNQFIEKIINHFENWEYPQQAMLAGNELRYFDVIKVPNQFQI